MTRIRCRWIELDRKLADLLETLGVPARQALNADAQTAHGNGQGEAVTGGHEARR